MNECSNLLAVHHTFKVANDVHVEYIDGQVVLFAHCGCGEVHYLEAAADNLVVADVVEFYGCGVFLGVGCVDAIHAGSFEHYVSLNLDAAK